MSPLPLASLPTYDITEPGVWQEPARYLSALRSQTPVARVVPYATYTVLRARDVERLMHDPRLVPIGTRGLEMSGVTEGIFYEWWKLMLFQTSPPQHTRLRALVSRAFTPRRADGMRPLARAVASELVEEAIESGVLDVTGRFAHEIPVRVVSAMLGVPDDDHGMFGGWANDIGLAFSPFIPPELRETVERALTNLYDYVGDLIADRRKAPRDDLITALVAAEEQGDRLSEDELKAMVVNLLFAGHDTTKGLLSIMLMLMATHPEQLAAVRASPALVAGAVEEVLRFEPVVGAIARWSNDAVEVGGYELPADAMITLSIASANHDPERVERPEVFDVTREKPWHVSFGHGLHFCLGAALARLEAQESLRVVAERLRRLELVDGPPQFVPFAAIRRFEKLRLGVHT